MDPLQIVEMFFAKDGPLSRLMPGYTPRDAQVQMARAVCRTLGTSGPQSARLVVEAGTGTGKSLAYLAAALASGKRVVVATGTKALQDQLVKKDAPLAVAAFHAVLDELAAKKPKADVALMKGRSNYLCKLRLERFALSPKLTIIDEPRFFAVQEFAKTTTTGDRADVPGLPDSWQPWSEIDAGGETCIGQKCAHYQGCHVTQMRQRAADAAIIVVNHHLLCADQRVRMDAAGQGGGGDGFGAVIPEAHALIVDEAHALPDVATDYFGLAVGSSRLERLVADARVLGDRAKGDARAKVVDLAIDVEDAGDALFQALRPLVDGLDRKRLGAQAPDLDALVAAAAQATRALSETFARFEDKDATDGAGTTFAVEATAVARRAQSFAAEVKVVLGTARTDARMVVYVEGRKRNVTATAAPIDVGDLLARTLFAADVPVVLTSATLAVAGKADAFLARAGVSGVAVPAAASDVDADDDDADDDDAADDAVDDAVDDAEPTGPGPLATMLLPSPFDHAHRAALYVPSGMPEPDQPTWTTRFDDEAKFLLTMSQGGALLLFTSHRGMNEAYDRLGPFLASHGIAALKQGDAPKMELLAALKGFDDKGGAALFATQSFWEGVDVQGRALRLVVVDRLPFKVPNDPVQQARAALLEAQGKSSFFHLSLPEAALALKQGAGRLLRSVDDAGVVALMDGRVRTKRYGEVFLDTLPPMTRVGSQRTLEEFWRRFVVPALALGGPSTTPVITAPSAETETAAAAKLNKPAKRRAPRKKRSTPAARRSRDPA